MSLLGYDLFEYFIGRVFFEVVVKGIELVLGDWVICCNLVMIID